MTRNNQATIPASRVDEIPTNPSPFKARVVSVAVIMLASLALAAWYWGPDALDAFLSQNTKVAILFSNNGSGNHLTSFLKICLQAFGVVGALCAVSGLLSLVRIRAAYHLLRVSLIAVYPVVAAYVILSWQGSFAIMDSGTEVGGNAMDKVTTLIFWWNVAWPALAVAAYAAWLQVMLRIRWSMQPSPERQERR